MPLLSSLRLILNCIEINSDRDAHVAYIQGLPNGGDRIELNIKKHKLSLELDPTVIAVKYDDEMIKQMREVYNLDFIAEMIKSSQDELDKSVTDLVIKDILNRADSKKLMNNTWWKKVLNRFFKREFPIRVYKEDDVLKFFELLNKEIYFSFPKSSKRFIVCSWRIAEQFYEYFKKHELCIFNDWMTENKIKTLEHVGKVFNYDIIVNNRIKWDDTTIIVGAIQDSSHQGTHFIYKAPNIEHQILSDTQKKLVLTTKTKLEDVGTKSLFYTAKLRPDNVLRFHFTDYLLSKITAKVKRA